MIRIGLLSDTHSHIDDKVLKHLSTCDEIWHAGDIGTREVITSLETIAPVFAVYGNIDNQHLRQEFPLNQYFEREGLHVFITHIAGYPGKYNSRVKHFLTNNPIDLFICGHSHILKVLKDKKYQHLHINPGASGLYGFHQVRTLIRFTMHQKKITDLEVVELER